MGFWSDPSGVSGGALPDCLREVHGYWSDASRPPPRLRWPSSSPRAKSIHYLLEVDSQDRWGTGL
jgi:hypothetical protein